MEREIIFDEIAERMCREMENFMDYESDENEPLYVDGFIECFNRMRNILENFKNE